MEVTLPKTNITTLKIGLTKKKVVPQVPFFRGENVSLRECSYMVSKE